MTTYKFYKLTNDKVFKAVFSKESNWDMLEELLYEVTDTRFKIISLLTQELPKNNIHKKGKILDVVAKTQKGQIVNIELNNSDSKYLHRRNFAYICGLYSESLKVSDTYQNMPMFIQINLTNNKRNIPLSISYTVNNKETGIEFVDNFLIYEINIQKAKETWYNKPKGKRLLALLDCNEEELNNAIGDDIVERLKKEVKDLNEDTEFIQFLSDEDEERLYINSLKQEFKEEAYGEGLKEGIEEGIEQGIEKGSNQRNIEIAKNMLNKGTDLGFISEVTGLNIKDIENLK